MPSRRFRYDRELGCMVELLDEAPPSGAPMIQGDLTQPFMDRGVLIDSKAKLREHMDRHNLVPFHVPDRNPSSGDQQRERQELREFLWEHVSKAFSMRSKPPKYRR